MEIEVAPKIEDSFPLSPDAKQLMEQFRRERETKVLTLFFSDLVGSAELQTEHGNVFGAQMVQSHYGILRAVLAEIDGKEISTSGDSMLVVFAAPSDAVKFALLSQRLMRIEQQKVPLLPSMRCGIHHGQVADKAEELNNRLILIYPEAIYVTVREPFEAMKGQRDRLLRERNSLTAM